MPPFPEFFPVLNLVVVLFVLLSLFLPGIFIWLGLKIIGRNVSVVKCALANLAALVVAFIITTLLSLTPLGLIFPLIFLLVYLYTLKALLDISFLEALGATIISAVIIGIIGIILALIFNVWVLSIVPKTAMHGRFIHF